MKLSHAPVLALLLLPAVAFAGGLGLTGKVGTLGFGGDLTVPLVDNTLNLRAGLNAFSLEDSVELDSSEVDAAIDLQTVPILLDWHPSHSGFRISAGAVINNNEADMDAGSDKVLILDEGVFPISDLNGSVTFDSVGYYLGIGTGNAAAADGRWHFACDFGLMYHGRPAVEATATSPVPGLQASLDAALANAVADLEDDLSSFVVYPVISLGASVRF